MHHLPTILFLLLYSIAAHAQLFGAEWMTSPSPADSSCQWFRRTFISAPSGKRPARASVCVAADSRFILYVNGRNVSTALFLNSHSSTSPIPGGTAPGGTRPTAITCDVTRFLRPDSNTVAVLACPAATATPHGHAATPPRISVSFFGTGPDGHHFAHSSADGWLCHAASTAVTAGGELTDGRADALPPAYGDMVMAQWQPVAIASAPATPRHSLSAESMFGHNPLGYTPLTDNAAYPHQTLRPHHFDTDGRTVTYDFMPGFCGFVRVTLRGCRRGERISIGSNLTYICSGEPDEQAFCRFSPQYARRIAISGDRWFRPGQVQDVEAIGI